MTPKQTRHMRLRILAVGSVFMVYIGIIAVRAMYLQVFCYTGLSRRAASEYEKSFDVPGKRGTIYDARLKEMAISLEVQSVAAYPPHITDLGKAAASLAGALGIPQQRVYRKLSASRSFVWLKRQITPKEVEAVKKLNIKGIGFIPEHTRFYPNRMMAAQVLGFTGIDGHGLEGIEFFYDAYLKGETARIREFKDALGRGFFREIPEGESRLSRDHAGKNLVLTIDRTIQFIAEKALQDAIDKHEAASGMVVVMSPKTGAVLAMAHLPVFNPNAFAEFDRQRWRNRAVTDPFEPGSTMKIFSATAAVEYGGATTETIFYCENGKYRIGEDVIHDTKAHGWLTLMNIIKYSSNIGSIKISEMIGPEVLYKTLRDFGFGEKTTVDCPGETTGSLSSPAVWSRVDAGAISYGYGISVSAVQLATAVSAIANDGVLMKPYIVQSVTDQNGKPVRHFGPRKVRRVISRETARTVKGMMAAVIREGGTGVRAALEGYTVCGKTGTAQKLSAEGEYSKVRYTASFVGFAPMDDPEVTILVVVGEPQNQHYGGVVAAPVFRRIAHETLNYMNIAPQPMRDRLTASRKNDTG